MNSLFRRRFASVALILGFFLAWELLCLAFGVKDIVLPRPSQIVVTLGQRMPAIWPHALQTLYTTLVGFALGIVAGVLLSAFVGIIEARLRRGVSAARQVLEAFRRSRWSDLRSLVRRRHHPGGADRDDPVRSHRGECHTGRHDRAGARRRDAGTQGPASSTFHQCRIAAHDAISSRL